MPENRKLFGEMVVGKLLFTGEGICVLKGLGVVGRISPLFDVVVADATDRG